MKLIKKRIRHKIVVITGIAIFLISSVFSLSAFADTQSILSKFGLESNSQIKTPVRELAWLLIVGLRWLVGGMENVVYNINDTLGGFFTSSGVKALEDKMLPIAIALIGVLILFIGIMTMIKPQQATTIVSNMIVGVAIAISLPTLLSAAFTFTNQAISYINSDSSGTLQKISDRILLDNVIDNTRYDQEGFKSTTLKYKSYYAMPGADGSKITTIDPTELVNPDNMKYPEVWKNIIDVDQNGKQTLEELYSGKWGFIDVPMFSKYYYRWKFDWLNIFITLIVTGFALIMSGIKIARLLYELAIHQTMTQIVALLDVMTAQRLKKCIQMLVATFGTLFAVFFMLQMYLLSMTYITNVSDIFLRIILMIALAWAVIDGPNLFEQIFGVDAGIHGALRTVYGMKAAGGIMAGGIAALGGKGILDAMKAKGLVGTAKSVANRAGGIAGSVGGTAAGVISGHKETAQRVNSVKSGIGAAAAAVQGVGAALGGSSSGGIPSAGGSQEPGAVGSGDTQARPVPSGGAPVGTSGGNDHNPAAANIHPDVSTSPLQDNVSGASSPSQQTTSSGTRKEQSAANEPETLGGHLRSAVAGKIQQSSAVTSARRAYSLTKTSSQAHGNKKVAREEKVQKIQNDRPDTIRRDAKKQAKQEIKQEKKGIHDNRSWSEQERDTERGNQLFKGSGDKK